MMMEMAAGDTIKEMDMFFPILNEAIYNFFDTFHAEPQRKPKKNRTTTEQPEEEPTTGEAEEESQ